MVSAPVPFVTCDCVSLDNVSASLASVSLLDLLKKLPQKKPLLWRPIIHRVKKPSAE